MTENSRTVAWIAAALATSLALAAVSLAHFGTGPTGTVMTLRLTARWAYCFFWPAYAGGALAATFGPRLRPLARRGRDLGLAFAAAQSIHVLLVTRLYLISPKPPLPLSAAIYFGIGIGFVYLLALFSIPSLAARLPPWLWRALRIVGMEYIALAFLRDFLQDPLDLKLHHVLEYAPFALLGLAALLLRLVGYARALPQLSSALVRIGRNASGSLR
jgi:hypothetical protein